MGYPLALTSFTYDEIWVGSISSCFDFTDSPTLKPVGYPLAIISFTCDDAGWAIKWPGTAFTHHAKD